MRPIPSISLSYNPVEIDLLTSKLKEYAARHHDDLIDDFESQMKSVFKVNHAIALNSGTAALHLALKALEVTKGDIVLASTFTYVASVNPILYLGATPFFVDSCKDDWNMDPTILEDAVKECLSNGKRPKAILVVHTYGMPARLEEILKIGEMYGIPILEDAAESIGATYKGAFTGTIGRVGIFSFNNNKLITTYGGGMLLTSDPLIARKINSWATQSRDNVPFYEHREVGYNYRMSPINAACGLIQTELMNLRILERIQHHQFYCTAFENFVPSVSFQFQHAGVHSNRWLTCVVLPFESETVRMSLSNSGIETRLLWKPMHLQPVFRSCPSIQNGVSEGLFRHGLCLPSGNNLSNKELQTVASHIKSILI